VRAQIARCFLSELAQRRRRRRRGARQLCALRLPLYCAKALKALQAARKALRRKAP